MSKKAPNPTDKHVGSRVRAARLARGWSQEKLGDGLGLAFQQVQKYEKGANRIGSSRLQQIASLLQVEVAWLFVGAPDAANATAQPLRDYGAELLGVPFGRELAENFLRLSNTADRRVVASVCAALAEREQLARMVAAE